MDPTLFLAALLATASPLAQDAGGAPPPEPAPEPAPAPEPEPAPALEPTPAPEAAPPVAPAPADPSALEPVTVDETNNAEPPTAATLAAPQGQDAPTPPIRVFRGDRTPASDPNELVSINFRDVNVESIFPFIVECTGKTLIPRAAQVRSQLITVISESAVSRQRALELIFQALRLNGIGVVETEDIVMIDLITEITKLQPAVVLGPDVDVRNMADSGQIVIKVYRIKHTKAQGVFDRLSTSLPDYAKLDVDNNSNQIVLEGDAGLAKRCQRIIDLLDVPPYVDLATETFRLEFTDAALVADNISTLFGSGRATGGSSRGGNQQQRGNRGQPQQGGSGEAPPAGTSEQLVVTVQPASNSITVRAEPDIMEQIRALVRSEWDIPINIDGDPFRVYDLKYTDPLKVRDVLSALLEAGGGGSSRSNRGGSNRVVIQGGGGGDSASADAAVANIFRIEAYPDSNRLIVVTKTPDNFKWLDDVVQKLDQPLEVGLPSSVPLKYQNCVEMAEMLNALLADSGSEASIARPEEGLGGIDFEAAGGGTGDTSGGTAPEDRATVEMTFPWQSGRGAGAEERSEVSALVGKARVVPNATQNSLLILAPPEIEQAIKSVIEDMDRPGRQVMINAVLAEVELGEQFNLGLKFGPDGSVIPANTNNAVVIGTNVDGLRDTDFPQEFNAFLFDFGVDATVVLQALDQDTSVRILQQPRVFTSDNKEAVFFQGQDIPFQASQSQGSTTGGSTVSNFEQIAVGIGLNVRPRITADGNVAMDIEILLSNRNVATPTGVGGNPVIDRRQTNTTITIKDGQTILISGIRLENESNEKTKVPLLGDIPILDLIFGSTENVTSVRELLIFVQPTVVNNPDDNDRNFNIDELERLKALTQPMDNAVKDLEKRRDLVNPPKPSAPEPTSEPLDPIRPSGDAAQDAATGGIIPRNDPVHPEAPLPPPAPSPEPAPAPSAPEEPVGTPP